MRLAKLPVRSFAVGFAEALETKEENFFL